MADSPYPEPIGERAKADELIERLNNLEGKVRWPEPDTMLKYFAFEHLQPPMQDVSRIFHAVADYLVNCEWVLDNRERQVALRKLLEAKDAAVRSVVTRD